MSDNLAAMGQILPLNRLRLDLDASLERRAETLWQADDRDERLKAMAPLELYYLAKEMGLEETLPVLAKASEGVVQRFCDLDCWHEERFDAEELDAYLAPFLNESKASLAEAFLALDDEVQILFVQASLQVFDNREDEPPQVPDDQPTRISPDGFFVLVNLAPEREVDPFVLIDALVEHGRDTAFKLLTASKWELAAGVEEEAFQFREARLMDMGFVDRQAALGLIAAPPKALSALVNLPTDAIEGALRHTQVRDVALVTAAEAGLPPIYAQALKSKDAPLNQALARLAHPVNSHHLLQEMVLLTNRLIVVRGRGAHNLRYVAEMAEEVRDTISLALDAVVPADRVGASDMHANVLASWSLAELFRLGVAQSQNLAQQALGWVKDEGMSQWLDATDDSSNDAETADRAFVKALLTRPPAFAGWDIQRPAASRAFRSTDEVTACEKRLEAIGSRVGSKARR